MKLQLLTPSQPLKDHAQKALYLILFAILILAIFFNQTLVRHGMETHNKFNDYVILLNLYQIVFDESQTSIQNYILHNDEEALEQYKLILHSKRKDRILENLTDLGVTEAEQHLINRTKQLGAKLRVLEEIALENEGDSGFGIQSEQPAIQIDGSAINTNNKIIFSVEYNEILQLHRETVAKLGQSIYTRMGAQVESNKNKLIASFAGMGFFAALVPTMLFRNYFRTKKINKKIQSDQELQEATLKNTVDGIISVDETGKINIFNPAAAEITNFTLNEAIGKNINEIIKFKDPSIQLCECFATKRGFCVKNEKEDYSYIVDKYGVEKAVNIICSKVTGYDNKLGVVFTLRDVTEKIAEDKEKERRQRLESLGRLAGGIAHDFNNALMVFGGNARLAQSFIASGDEEKALQFLKGIEKESQSAQRLTNKLLTFARGGMPIKGCYKLTNILRQSINLALKDSNFEKTIKCSDKDIFIDADFEQMIEVFTNILTNAKEAMASEDSLWIDVSKVEVKQSDNLIPGKYALIQVSNNGQMIPEVYIQNIFEPYFSTKGSKGLGLPASYSIIKNHNGYIDVKSDENNTRFIIYLPIVEPEDVGEQQANKNEGSYQKLNILIMDDEEKIQAVTKNFLIQMGHNVDTASSGEEAIFMYKQRLNKNEPYDLLILDLIVMPGMGGKETIGKLLEIDPNVKAIVSSGYSNDAVMANYKEHGFIGVLPKPFSYEKLEKILKEKYPG